MKISALALQTVLQTHVILNDEASQIEKYLTTGELRAQLSDEEANQLLEASTQLTSLGALLETDVETLFNALDTEGCAEIPDWPKLRDEINKMFEELGMEHRV